MRANWDWTSPQTSSSSARTTQAHLWELLEAGLGIGFGQANLVPFTPVLVALPIKMGIPPLPIWLTTHGELFTSARIRAIYDALASGLSAYINGVTSPFALR